MIAVYITNITLETGEELVYGYDTMQRLISEVREQSSEVGGQKSEVEYSYDKVGNRLTKTLDGITVNYNHPYGTSGNGNTLPESAIGNRYLWQGRKYSYSTGLYYFRTRWYDPITGRWLSKDPIGISGGLNQYIFCGNNPVMFVDPYGLSSVVLNGFEQVAQVVSAAGIAIGEAAVVVQAGAVVAAGGVGWWAGNQIRDPLIELGENIGEKIGNIITPMEEEHTNGARPSTKGKHDKGRRRKIQDKTGGKKKFKYRRWKRDRKMPIMIPFIIDRDDVYQEECTK